MVETPVVSYLSKDYEGFRADLLAGLQAKIAEYKDFSESDVGVVILELLAHGMDVQSYYIDKVANEVFLETARERESVINHCRLIGYELQAGISAKYTQVFEITPQPTAFTIPSGTQLVTGSDGQVFEVVTELVIPAGKTGLEKDIAGAYLYTTTVVHGYWIDSDVIGSSAGTKWQKFKLNYAPAVLEDLLVQVDSGNGLEAWTKVDSFIDSDANATVYRIVVDESDNTYIEFGSGYAGKIPPIVENGIVVSYRVGGGVIGNVPLNTITEVDTPLAGILSTTNVAQVQAGQSKESLEQAKIRAQAKIRTWDRAVTQQDYADLALMNPNVRLSSTSVSILHGVVTICVYVLLNDGVSLSDEVRLELESMYEDKREIGREVVVSGATFVPTTVTAMVQISHSYKHSEMRETITGVVEDFFALGERPFGEVPAQSEIIGELMPLTGVRAVDVELNVTELKPNEIMTLQTLSLTIVGGVNDEQ